MLNFISLLEEHSWYKVASIIALHEQNILIASLCYYVA